MSHKRANLGCSIDSHMKKMGKLEIDMQMIYQQGESKIFLNQNQMLTMARTGRVVIQFSHVLADDMSTFWLVPCSVAGSCEVCGTTSLFQSLLHFQMQAVQQPVYLGTLQSYC